jgi:hypothetical protein
MSSPGRAQVTRSCDGLKPDGGRQLEINAAEARSNACTSGRAAIVADAIERFEKAVREFAEGDTRLRFVTSQTLVARRRGALVEVRFTRKTEAHIWTLGFGLRGVRVTNEAGGLIEEKTAFSTISGQLFSSDASYPTRQAAVGAGGRLLIRLVGEGCAVVLVAERD